MSKSLEERVSALESTLAAIARALGGASHGGSTASAAEGAIADDRDLDSQYGDPVIKKDPTQKYWPGQSYVGRKYSQCPADYLEAMARYKDACAFMNEKDGSPDKLKYAGYDRKDGARARGWAQRIRSRAAVQAPLPRNGGGGVSAQHDDFQPTDADDIPFIVNMTLRAGERP